MITPTVGRIVLYTASANPGDEAYSPVSDQKMAAIVTYVHNDRSVDIHVFAPPRHNEKVEADRIRVALIHRDEHDVWPDDEGYIGEYCEWMPYQKAVAAGSIAPTLHTPAAGNAGLAAEAMLASAFDLALDDRIRFMERWLNHRHPGWRESAPAQPMPAGANGGVPSGAGLPVGSGG